MMWNDEDPIDEDPMIQLMFWLLKYRNAEISNQIDRYQVKEIGVQVQVH